MKQNNFFQKSIKAMARIKETYKQKGICYIICAGIDTIFNWLISFDYYYYRIFKSTKTFIFQGNIYNYFYHKNTTWRNERVIEIPIIWEMVKKYPKKNILEIGNVLSNYFSVNHDILDKYEKTDGVISQDVVDFRTSKKYDLIVSISTLEHVGWDEKPRESMKILHAIENLEKLLAPGGKIVITLPLGYNPPMDTLLKEKKIRFTKQYYLKRISKDNKWKEGSLKDIQDAKYNNPFPAANGLIIGMVDKNDLQSL